MEKDSAVKNKIQRVRDDPYEVIKDYGRSLEIKERFADAVGKSFAGVYIQAALLAVSVNPDLQRCTPQSIFASALRAATMRLLVDPSVGHAYIVPYKGSATLIVGYKGIYHMAMRTEKYRYINIIPFHEGEWVDQNKLTGELTPCGEIKTKEIIGWMGAFELLNGFRKQIYMTIEEIHEHAKRWSPSYSYKTSRWQTDPRVMERKTVLKRLITQWGYLDPTDMMALSKVDEEEYIDADLHDLPDADDVTIEEPYYKEYSQEQLLDELGFDQ